MTNNTTAAISHDYQGLQAYVPELLCPGFSPSPYLTDKVIVITGGETLFAQSVALQCMLSNAYVVLVYTGELRQIHSRLLQMEYQAGHRRLLPLPANLDSRHNCRYLLGLILSVCHNIDCVVNINQALLNLNDSYHTQTVNELEKIRRQVITQYQHVAEIFSDVLSPSSLLINSYPGLSLLNMGAALDRLTQQLQTQSIVPQLINFPTTFHPDAGWSVSGKLLLNVISDHYLTSNEEHKR